MNTPIVILALPKHDDNFTSTPYQLALKFAETRSVLYVSHPYSWIDFLRNPRDAKLRKRFMATRSGGNIEMSEHPNLQILILPLVLSINWLPPGILYDWLCEFNHRIVINAINNATRRLGLTEYNFINSHDYFFAHVRKKLTSVRRYVYQCIDPIIKAYSARHGRKLEAEAARYADLVISTSPSLNERMLEYNPNSFLVPNAANFDLCNRAMDPETGTIPSIDRLEGLKFGYVGNIERRINYDLLIEIFGSVPEWQLVMIGPKDISYIPDEFLSLPNLTLLPPVSHEQVPEVLKSVDIAIIPFLCDEVSAQIYPLKMFEYLASGKPVITTNFNPEVIRSLGATVHIASDKIQFVAQVNEISMTEDANHQTERIEVARANDWSQRSGMILDLI